jgi:hypothetical protein
MAGTAPPGWHSDPSGVHEFRYWDGTRWSEHVADHGIASVDGGTATTSGSDGVVRQAGTNTSPPVLLDVQLRIGVRAKRLFMDSQVIAWGRDLVPYAGITAMAWWVTKVVAGPAHTFEYRMFLWAGEDETKIYFIGRGEHVRDSYSKAVEVLFHHAGRRICSEALSSLDAGQTVRFAGITLTRTGLADGKTFHSWSTPLTVTRMVGSAGVYVGDALLRKTQAIPVYFELANGPLVPPLLEACQRRYGSG